MNFFLTWVVPPCMGALIGYVTNVVAVKMLFRPLREIRIFRRFRLPFTPGILPRQRGKLAENIGAMVERELLTAEVLSARLNRPDVREGIRRSVADFTGTLLARPPADFFAPPPGDPAVPGFVSLFLRDLVRGPGFARFLGALGEALAVYARQGGLPERSLRDILGDGAVEGLEKRVEGWLEVFLAELPENSGFWSPLTRAAEEIYPRAAARFIRFLEGEEIRRTLEIQGQVFLSRVITKLNVFQRFFVSAGQYDRTLQERMPEIIGDLIDQIRDLLLGGDLRSRLPELLTGGLRRSLASGETRSRLARFIAGGLAALADRPLGDFFPPGEAALPLQKLPGFFSSLAGSGGGDPRFAGILYEKITEALRKPAGGEESLAGFLSLEGEKKAALDAFIAEKLRGLAAEQAGAILGSINVRALVSGRIDELDMVRVERIVLDVMANQLKWINLFGGLLGALIGLSQSLLSLFTR